MPDDLCCCTAHALQKGPFPKELPWLLRWEMRPPSCRLRVPHVPDARRLKHASQKGETPSIMSNKRCCCFLPNSHLIVYILAREFPALRLCIHNILTDAVRYTQIVKPLFTLRLRAGRAAADSVLHVPFRRPWMLSLSSSRNDHLRYQPICET